MAVASHSDDIEVQEEDDDEEGDTAEGDAQTAEEDYDDIDGQTAEEGNVDTQAPTRLKYPPKKRQSVNRQFKLLGMGLGLLCVVQALLNIGLRLSLYSEWMKEKDNLIKDLEQMTDQKNQIQSSYKNLTDQKNQIQSSYKNLTDQKNQLQSSYKNLTDQKNQLQSSYNRLIENPDELKRIRCEPHGFTFDGGLCYYISKSTEGKTWDESRQDCRDKQADLIIMKSKEKQDLVGRVVPGDQGVWIGLTDREEEGSFKWMDGTPLTSPTFWEPGQPGGGGGDEDCVYYYNRVSVRGWADWSCSYSLYWMCERVV